MPSFEELLSGNKIFAERNALSPHFVPEILLYRENEVRRMMLALAPITKGEKGKNVFLYGKTGSGKTSSARFVLSKLEPYKANGVFCTYMNCRVYDSRYKVLQKILSELKPHFSKTGHSFTLLYEELINWIEQGARTTDASTGQPKSRHVVLLLDEIDLVDDLDNLVYTLTRTNDDLHLRGTLSIIGISNKVNFKSKLDARSLSSLCEEEIVFQPYNAEQLSAILRDRCKLAFQPNTVDESAINLASAIAASENGDARYALLLMLRAAELAEARDLSTISDKEVEDARKMADEDKAFEIISTLPEHQRLVLYALAGLAEDVHYKKLVEDGGEKLYPSGEVYERYASQSKRSGRTPRSSRWYREYVTELESLGLLNAVSSGKGVRGHTTLLKLAYDPAKVKAAVERSTPLA